MQRAGLRCGERVRGLNAEPRQVGHIPEQRGLAPALPHKDVILALLLIQPQELFPSPHLP